ncbi:MAG: ABC transporter substrate-binding protein [Cellulosilyticaceae bacterium]
MNKKMRAVTLMLAAMMAMSAMVGCSGGKEQTDGAKSGDTVNLTWWAIGNEPKDLKIVNEAINEYTKEKLNVTVDMKYVSWGEYGEKLSKIVQSGENYDIAFGAGISNYTDLANKGYFADLTDLLPTVTPDLHKFMPEDLWKGVTVNEEIFGVPAYKDSSQSQYWVWDKELVDRLGIDVSTMKTLPELEPALKKIKEDDPSKYPLILQGQEGVNGFMAAVNSYDELLDKPYVGVKYDDASATVVSMWDQADVMDNLKILHKWFNEGLINPDAATLTEYPKYRPLGSDQGYPHAEIDWARTRQYPVVANQYFGPAYSTKTIQGSFLVVSAGSKHIEESMKLIELVNTDMEFRNLLAFGIEGTHYNKTGDTTIEVLNDGYQVPAYSQGTFFNMYTVDPAPATKWADLEAQQATAFSSPALGFTFNTQKVQNQVAACANIQEKYKGSLTTGSVDPEKVVPQMMAELNKAGYQDIIIEAQTQLDAYLGK